MSETQKKTTPRRIRYPKRWFVMLHLEPETIELMLQRENEQRRSRRLRLFEYFIPYLFLPKALPDAYAKDAAEQTLLAEESNDLRRTLRSYVFIKASDREIARLVRRDWNRQARLQLFFYNNHDGSHIIMPEKQMQQFITTCCEHRQRFTFGPPIVDLHTYDTVVIKEGTFKDTEAVILDVQHSAHGTSLTLGIPFFCGEKTLQLKDVSPSDLHLPLAVETLLNDHFIDTVEQRLLTVLAHRMKGTVAVTADEEASDEAILTQIYHYSYLQLHDAPSHLRFRCLILLCATLRMDFEGRQSLISELATLLMSDASVLPPSDQALLHATLYIATANVDHRTIAKTYWQSHRDADTPLSRLMPLVTRLNRKFFKHHRIQ